MPRFPSLSSLETTQLAAPTMTSVGRPWGGVVVDWHDWSGAGSAFSPALDHDVIGMRTAGTVRLAQVRDGQTHVATVGIGNVTVHPRGMESRWSWDGPGSVILMRMPPALLRQAAESGLRGAPQASELRNCFGRRDPFVEQIATQFLHELRRAPHPEQEYIAQALSQALALHLVLRFNRQPGRERALPERTARGLNARSLARVKEFIEAHLHEHIDLGTLACVANVSRFHFARLFKESTGSSAMAYLEQARMRRARALILLRRLPLAQVAAQVGYEDQSYFTRRFRLLAGVTPTAFAREGLGATRMTEAEWR